MKSIKLSEDSWQILLSRLHEDYPRSVLAIREKTKKVLGFTPRAHSGWISNPRYESQLREYNNETLLGWLSEPSKGHYTTFIFLDFYSENKQTFFLLKYGEYITI
jgi:hypothetical protein